MSGYIIDRENQEIVVNIPNVEQLSTTSVIFAGGLSLSDLENEEVNDILELVETYSPGPGPGPTPPTPPTPGPEIEPFYVSGWFEHQDGNWVLVKAGQTWQIQYSEDGFSWTDASYTASDVDTWFNMDNEPFRMAKYAKRKVASATGDNKILAMNLDMPNHLGSFINSSTTNHFSIYNDTSIINVKIKIDHFEGSLVCIFHNDHQMTTCEIEQYRPELMNVTSMTNTFGICYSLHLLKGLENWDVSKVTSMANTFYNCASLQSLDLSNWDVSKVTSMNVMFDGCYSLQSLKGIENWDVSKVTTMQQMFNNCYSLQSLDLSNWDVSKVTNMMYTFNNCYSLQSLDLSKWNTSNVTTFNSMFSGCYSLQSLDLSNWDVSKVDAMSCTFTHCNSLQSLDLSKWNTSNVTTFNSMFSGCYSLQSLDLSNWDVSKVDTMSSMFSDCDLLRSLKGIENWNVSNVTTMQNMFYKCNSLQSLDLSKWYTSKVTNMQNIFGYCYSLQSLDLSNWDVSKVTNMQNMFQFCSSLTDLKIKSKSKTAALPFYNQNYVLSNDSLKWMTDNFIDISGDATYTNKTISGFTVGVKLRYMWQYFYDTMTAKGYTIS